MENERTLVDTNDSGYAQPASPSEPVVKKIIVSPDSKPCHVKVPHHFDFGVLARDAGVLGRDAEVAMLNKAPLIYFVQFLLPDEIEEIIKAIDDAAAADRTGASHTSLVLKKELFPKILERAAGVFSLPLSHAEDLIGGKYDVASQIRANEPETSDREHGGQRLATIHAYLNDTTVEDGGLTDFPVLDIQVKPIKSAALTYYNLSPDGTRTASLERIERPVTAAGVTKYTVTFSFREFPLSTTTAQE